MKEKRFAIRRNGQEIATGGDCRAEDWMPKRFAEAPERKLEKPETSCERLLSLDTLRGFDMFFITGGTMLILGVCAALGLGDGCWLAVQMSHAEWVGFTQHDTIFPLFLFLAGATWPFSLASQEAKGRSKWQICRKIAVRSLVLFLLGLSIGGILRFSPKFRLMSVLGFIGLSWGAAAFVRLFVRWSWMRWAIAAALLAWTYCILHFFVAPDAAAGTLPYTCEGNLPMWLDRMLWPNHMLSKGFDPESLFSLPGGIAIALMGTFAGGLLRSDALAPSRKAFVLALAAVASAAAAYASVRWLGDPIIKKLWTVSFVFASVAYSLAMLSLFYWIIDVKGWRGWTVAFSPVGKNSILAYMLMLTGVTAAMYKFAFAGLCDNVGVWGKAVKGLSFYLLTWGVLFYLGKKRVFLKV